jgi:hypothetical protein
MMPLLTALSRARIAASTAPRASAPRSPTAARAVLTAVRTWDRTIRLRVRRFSFCRIRFNADFVFATEESLLGPVECPHDFAAT